MQLRYASVIALALGLFLGADPAGAMLPQGAASTDTSKVVDRPVVGRAIPCTQGTILAFQCQNVELLAYLPRSAVGNSTGFDLWGWHDSTTGREFLLISGGATTAFVEVTDPINPKYLGILPPHDSVKSGAGAAIKVYKTYAFIGYEGINNGLQVFDLTQLRNVKNAPVVFKETAHYAEFTMTHTLALNPETGFAYANGTETCGTGLHIVDVRNPLKPVFAGCYANTDVGGAAIPFPGIGGGVQVGGGAGYVHDTQCVVYRGPDQQYKGREICVNASGNAVVIVDVTDKQQPKLISVVRYPNMGYAHQGWLTEDQQYFFLDDELDEGMTGGTRTIGFDMRDLDDPVVATEFINTTFDTDHNLYIRGRYIYEGNYDAGLRIIDITDPRHPKEAGYLTKVGSAWGTYPYFKDGVVAVSTTTGLILARLQAR